MGRIESRQIRTGLISTTPITDRLAETSKGILETSIADPTTMTTKGNILSTPNMTTEAVIIATTVRAGVGKTTLPATTAPRMTTGIILLLSLEFPFPRDCRRRLPTHIPHPTIEIIFEMIILRMIQATTIAALLSPTPPARREDQDLLPGETIRAHTTEILLVQRIDLRDLDTDHRVKVDLLPHTMIQDHPVAVETEAIRPTTEATVEEVTRLHMTPIGSSVHPQLSSVLPRLSSMDIRANHIAEVEVEVAVAAEGAGTREIVYGNRLADNVENDVAIRLCYSVFGRYRRSRCFELVSLATAESESGCSCSYIG